MEWSVDGKPVLAFWLNCLYQSQRCQTLWSLVIIVSRDCLWWTFSRYIITLQGYSNGKHHLEVFVYQYRPTWFRTSYTYLKQYASQPLNLRHIARTLNGVASMRNYAVLCCASEVKGDQNLVTSFTSDKSSPRQLKHRRTAWTPPFEMSDFVRVVICPFLSQVRAQTLTVLIPPLSFVLIIIIQNYELLSTFIVSHYFVSLSPTPSRSREIRRDWRFE